MRYYEPNKAELCVGMDYEVFIPERNCWSLEVFYLNESHLELIKNNKIRVKYLDREDITDCGWEWSKYCFKIMDKNPSHIIELRLFDDGKIHICKNLGTNERDCNSVDYDTLFDGIIKNKSELRRLMQQLMITVPN